jgi:hypothetical protein
MKQAERIHFLLSRRAAHALCVGFCGAITLFFGSPAHSQDAPGTSGQAQKAAQDTGKESRESGPPVRIPRQQALTTAAVDGVVRESTTLGAGLPVPAAQITVRSLATSKSFQAATSAEGVFRLFPLPPGEYEFRVEAKDHAVFVVPRLTLQANEVVSLEISLLSMATLKRVRVCRVCQNLARRFPMSGSHLPELIVNFGIASMRILPMLIHFRPKSCPRSRTSITSFPIAGHWSNPTTAAIRSAVNTFTPSRIGTILSIAID